MKNPDNYLKAISELTSKGKFYIKLGLERVQEVLGLFENPQDQLKFIHVAGTNGKGSVCSMLTSILTESGQKVGLFTSPHIYEYTERIKINEQDISREDFAFSIMEVLEVAEKNNIHLTEFEIITVAAFNYFAQNNVDVVVLETGLGGRLDATNVVKNNIFSIITNIDLDHTERLGDSVEKIAFEKAGIIKKNCPVIISRKNAGWDVIKKVADEKGSVLIEGLEAPISLSEKSALKGKYQVQNIELVFTAIEKLKKDGYTISEKAIDIGLQKTKHPCRFEYLPEYNLIIDGAHNPDGAKVLRETLDLIYPNQNFKFVFGCLKNKNYKQMMDNLFNKNDEIYLYNFDNPNSATIEELENVCIYPSKLFDAGAWSPSDCLTVICGSFYMIKELLQKMGIK